MTAIGDWLTSLGACAPSIPVFAGASSVAAGYAAIAQPDWFLWFCLAQSTSVPEKQRVLGILQGVMMPTITAQVANSTAQAPVAAGAADLAAFLNGSMNVVQATADVLALASLPTSTPAVRGAVTCMTRILHVCLAIPGGQSGSAGSALALSWLSLLQLLGTLPQGPTGATTLTTSLRNAIPLNNLSGLP